MEDTEINKKYIIVIINNIKGNISRLNMILNKISIKKQYRLFNFNR